MRDSIRRIGVAPNWNSSHGQGQSKSKRYHTHTHTHKRPSVRYGQCQTNRVSSMPNRTRDATHTHPIAIDDNDARISAAQHRADHRAQRTKPMAAKGATAAPIVFPNLAVECADRKTHTHMRTHNRHRVVEA